MKLFPWCKYYGIEKWSERIANSLITITSYHHPYCPGWSSSPSHSSRPFPSPFRHENRRKSAAEHYVRARGCEVAAGRGSTPVAGWQLAGPLSPGPTREQTQHNEGGLEAAHWRPRVTCACVESRQEAQGHMAGAAHQPDPNTLSLNGGMITAHEPVWRLPAHNVLTLLLQLPLFSLVFLFYFEI